jgi:hypothetical protein
MKIRLASQVDAPGGHVTALGLVQFDGVLGVTRPVTALPRMPAGFEVPVLSTAAQPDTATGAGALLLLAAGDSHMQTVALGTAKFTVTPRAAGARAGGSRAL